MKIEELKKLYDKQPLQSLESTAKEYLRNTYKYRENFINLMFYLESTSRYKEDPVYKNEPFKKYIFEQFGTAQTTYENERWAFKTHPGHSEKYGPHLVNSIEEKCGRLKIVKVFSQIEKCQAKRKTELTRSDIQKIIDQNKKPEKPKPVQLDTVTSLRSELEQARKTIAGLSTTNSEQAAQIGKLKTTVVFYKEKYNEMMAIMGSQIPDESIPPHAGATAQGEN